MSGWLRWARLGGGCAAMVVAYFVAPLSPRLPTEAVVVRGLVASACLVLLASAIVWQIRQELDPTQDHRVDGLVLAVVGVELCFAVGFHLLELRTPSQLAGVETRLDALYLTMTTLTTVGYGDAHAVGQTARALVLVQMVFNLVFVASAAALLSGRVRQVAMTRAVERAAGRAAGSPPRSPGAADDASVSAQDAGTP